MRPVPRVPQFTFSPELHTILRVLPCSLTTKCMNMMFLGVSYVCLKIKRWVCLGKGGGLRRVPACQRAGRRGEGDAKVGSAGQSPRAWRQGLPAAALRDADEVVPRRQDGPALRLRRGGGETCPVHKASTARSGGSTRADAYLVGVTFPPEKGSPRTSRPGILNCVNSCHAS